MAEVTQRTFRVTLDVTVTIRVIDDELIHATQEGFHNESLARDPIQRQHIARDRRLLAALLNTPDALTSYLIRKVGYSLDSIVPDDESLDAIMQRQLDDTAMVDALRTALPEDDFQFLRDVAAEGILYDNTSYFEEALTTRQGNVTIEELPAGGALGEEKGTVTGEHPGGRDHA
jgi:hypothetical protein